MPDYVVIEDETLRQGFTQIPNAILRRPDISPGAKLTYMVLLSYAWQEGSCFPGQVRMAQDMGVTDRSVRTYLRELETTGLLITRRRGFGKTNLYFLPRSENISGHERIEASALDRKNLPTKHTQLKGSTQKNMRNTQWTEQEHEAYFQKFAEENAEHLAMFLHADNHGSKKGG